MASQEWVPKIIYIGRDTFLERKLLKAISPDAKYYSCRSTDSAGNLIKEKAFDVVIYDEEINNVETFEGRITIPFSEIYGLSITKNPKVTFIFLYSKNNTFIREFTKANSTTLLYQREKITSSRLAFALHFLRRRYFRSLFLWDLVTHKSYFFDIFRYDNIKGEYVLYVDAGKTLPETFRKDAVLNHLYMETDLFHQLSTEDLKSLRVTKAMNEVRKLYKSLMSDLIDDSSINDVKKGNELRPLANKIVQYLIQLINVFPGSYHACSELPYSLNSLIGHGLNTCIYSLIFSEICTGNYNEEMAVAGLLQDLGMASIDFHLVKKGDELLTLEEKVTLEGHVVESINILRSKMFKTSKVIDDCILYHHEAGDGMGFPHGIKSSTLSFETKLFIIADSFERIRVLSKKGTPKSVEDTLKILKEFPTQRRDIYRYDRAIIEMLETGLIKKKQKVA